MTDSFTAVLTFVFGAMVGSFLNVVILRLPEEGRSIVFPASHCPRCGHPIRWFDNIPILSFILLRRRCRDCGEPISFQYPLVELAMALLSLALFRKFGAGLAYAIYFPFLAALLAIIFIDLRHQIIPDAITLPGIVLGFLLAFANPLVSWQEAGLGLLLGGGSLYAVAAGYYLFTRREGMGGGDIKLLAMIGAFLGWQSLPFVIFSSSLIGTIAGIGAMIKQRKGGQTVIPYGPFLALGGMLYLFFREEIISYLSQLWHLQ
ncbi:MAG: prepilin peptidase [Desulfobacteraceae bacterium]|nr:prepilin peptidase [Desulfobacteraceae bacterium]